MRMKDFFRKMNTRLNSWINKKVKNGLSLKSSPYEFNSALFTKFYNDLRCNALPNIPDPTNDEIMDYKLKRQSRSERKNHYASSDEQIKWQNNMAIPVEVEIWVDKVFEYYFDDLRPMLGLIHWCEGARKELYQYKGYIWYTISEVYPYIQFD